MAVENWLKISGRLKVLKSRIFNDNCVVKIEVRFKTDDEFSKVKNLVITNFERYWSPITKRYKDNQDTLSFTNDSETWGVYQEGDGAIFFETTNFQQGINNSEARIAKIFGLFDAVADSIKLTDKQFLVKLSMPYQSEKYP